MKSAPGEDENAPHLFIELNNVKTELFTKLLERLEGNLERTETRDIYVLEINGLMGSGKTRLGKELCLQMSAVKGVLIGRILGSYVLN